MKAIKLSCDLLIGSHHYVAGDVVMVPDERAKQLVSGKFAEDHDGSGVVANPDHNPLEDVTSPEPPKVAPPSLGEVAAPDVKTKPAKVETTVNPK